MLMSIDGADLDPLADATGSVVLAHIEVVRTETVPESVLALFTLGENRRGACLAMSAGEARALALALREAAEAAEDQSAPLYSINLSD
jgi:hypothetical protein